MANPANPLANPVANHMVNRYVFSNDDITDMILMYGEAYHFQRVQDLLPQDYAVRVRFCEWLIGKHEENPNKKCISYGRSLL